MSPRWWPSRHKPQPTQATHPDPHPAFERFTAGARRVVVLTEFSARRRQSAHVRSSDLLVGLLLAQTDEPGGNLLLDAELSPEVLYPETAGGEPFTFESKVRTPFGADTKAALLAAQRASEDAGHEVIAPLHLLLGALTDPSGTARRLLLARGANPDRIADAAAALFAGTELPALDSARVTP